MNPPYTGRRTAADAQYKVGDVKEARRAAHCVLQSPTPALPRKRERGKNAFAANTDSRTFGNNAARILAAHLMSMFPDAARHTAQRAPSPACGGGLGWGPLA